MATRALGSVFGFHTEASDDIAHRTCEREGSMLRTLVMVAVLVTEYVASTRSHVLHLCV